ncbi:hypothetical protein KAR91_18190 [Candidatus Pacearchaeota archaeon]|nr:hypothetical protein [Candidatus Pacearchaeota archaeon]
MFQRLEQLCGSLQSYTGAALGYLTHLDLMQIGAALLLIVRLVVDIPRAYKAISSLFKKEGL